MKAYQMKITIKNSHPPIWRRFLVPAGLSFSQFGLIVNTVMGWSGGHLNSYNFKEANVFIEEYDEEDDLYDQDYILDSANTIIDIFFDVYKKCIYTYDFGDNWEHTIVVEDVLDDYDCNYPQIIKSKGNTPFEDCGGIYGYYEIIEAINDPSHLQHKDYREWLEAIEYQEYDVEEVNENLKNMFVVDEACAPVSLQEIYDVFFENYEIKFKKVFTTVEPSKEKKTLFDLDEDFDDEFADLFGLNDFTDKE